MEHWSSTCGHPALSGDDLKLDFPPRSEVRHVLLCSELSCLLRTTEGLRLINSAWDLGDKCKVSTQWTGNVIL